MEVRRRKRKSMYKKLVSSFIYVSKQFYKYGRWEKLQTKGSKHDENLLHILHQRILQIP